MSTFRRAYPAAWDFHQNTCRWPHNAVSEAGTDVNPDPGKEYLGAPTVALPAATVPGVALEQLLRGRLSCRRFADEPLRLAEVGAVAGAAYGVSGAVALGDLELVERPVPSAGGMYPLELYLLVRAAAGLAPGLYHYAPLHHLLEQLNDLALPRRLVSELFLGQPYAADAGAVVVLTAVLHRSLKKYGDRGYRYLLLEAGHTAQNLNLAAAALGLGTCNLGGFFDHDLAELLGVDVAEEIPLYATAVGRPADADRSAARTPGA